MYTVFVRIYYLCSDVKIHFDLFSKKKIYILTLITNMYNLTTADLIVFDIEQHLVLSIFT